MKASKRARRMARHHARNRRGAGLNLVSLMDIFTILVFFLLVNSSEVQTLENPRDISLPESASEQKPNETVVIHVSSEQILVQGRPVATLAAIEADVASVIEPLKAALEQQAGRVIQADVAIDPATREVTILGDKELPYRLLKKIMMTCTEAQYGKISLAVLQRPEDVAQVAVANRG